MWRAGGSAPSTLAAAVGVTAAALAVGSGVARRYFATGGRRAAAMATVTRRRPVSVGDLLENVETPCLVVDLDAVRYCHTC